MARSSKRAYGAPDHVLAAHAAHQGMPYPAMGRSGGMPVPPPPPMPAPIPSGATVPQEGGIIDKARAAAAMLPPRPLSAPLYISPDGVDPHEVGMMRQVRAR